MLDNMETNNPFSEKHYIDEDNNNNNNSSDNNLTNNPTESADSILDKKKNTSNQTDKQKGSKRASSIARACDICRQKHAKCDGLQPLCTHCREKRLECTYGLFVPPKNTSKEIGDNSSESSSKRKGPVPGIILYLS